MDLIVKDAKGEILINKKLSKFSDIFKEENRHIISKVCNQLTGKAKYIIEERHSASKKEEVKLNPENFLDNNYLYLDE